MKKIIASLHVSLDGFAAGPSGEMDWIRFDDEMFDFVGTFTHNADTALYGRITWQIMDNYWPTAGDPPGASRHDKEHSKWYTTVDKIVLSKSLPGTHSAKTTFINANIADEIGRIKERNGKDILIFGSPSVVRLLTTLRLIDEYWLFVNPVILGKGISIFPQLNERIELTQQQTKIFPCGVTAINYSTHKK